MSAFTDTYPALLLCAERTRIASIANSAPETGNAYMLNIWHKFFITHNRPDLAREIVTAGEMTPALHAEWLALQHADVRRSTRLSNISTY